jgi:hypothetical protein
VIAAVAPYPLELAMWARRRAVLLGIRG